MSVYVLFVMFLADGIEREWKTYTRFEECLEAARAVVAHRDSIVARCVLKENK